MSRIRDGAIHFEAVKIALKQDKKGTVLTLSIHPDDTPPSLWREWIGSRYTVAMVQLDEFENVVMTEEQVIGAKAVEQAGIICLDQSFQRFLSKETGESVFGKEDCRDVLCSVLGITSRAELKEDSVAREAFREIKRRFDETKRITNGRQR